LDADYPENGVLIPRRNTTGLSGQNLSGITSSADGTRLAVIVHQHSTGDVWTSTDGGATWTDQTGSRTVVSDPVFEYLASSADGTKLAATEFNDNSAMTTSAILTSSDGGVTWIDDTAGTSTAGDFFWTIASSADGTKLAVVDTNYGDIWTSTLSPALTTSAASSLAESSGATLNGNIDDVGVASSTVRGFVYGTDNSYGATTTENGSFGTGSFTADLSSLSCNTTYHFAAYANNGYLGYGNDETFTTSACPSNGAPAGLLGGGGGGGGSVAVALPNNGSEAATTTSASTTPVTATSTAPTTQTNPSGTTEQLVSLYTALLQLLQQELSLLRAMRGN
jgi:hypothetical protein